MSNSDWYLQTSKVTLIFTSYILYSQDVGMDTGKINHQLKKDDERFSWLVNEEDF